jgi:hypothetical protein
MRAQAFLRAVIMDHADLMDEILRRLADQGAALPCDGPESQQELLHRVRPRHLRCIRGTGLT